MGRPIQVFKPTMKTFRVALLTVCALIDLSWQARPPSQSLYGPPSSPHRPHPSPPSSPPGHHQPSCRQVPKEVCKQVPRQTYESVTSVEMFLTKSVPRQRRGHVPSNRDLSRNTPTRRSAPSTTGRSVRTPRTSRSNVPQSRMKNATVLPSFNVSSFQRMSKKPSTKNNVPLSMTLSVL